MDEFEHIGATRTAIQSWYRLHGRQLAFRASAEPWGVLVSEVMLQQTQVPRVEQAWPTFMASYATPAALAAGTPADAIRAWAGLGYNRRALNLWRAATQIVERHGGEVPRRLEELRALPGVGEYTARAVAAISHRMPVAAVDTNVRRVVLRLAGPAPARDVQVLADSLVDPNAPDTWTHAVMDIGATLCRPRMPRCDACPLVAWCAFAAGPSGLAETAPAAGATNSSARGRQIERFEHTSRWLRGRIIDRLRETDAGAWLTVAGPIGTHDETAVSRAITALAADGMVEVVNGNRVRLAAAHRRSEAAA